MPHFVIDCSELIVKLKSPEEIIQKVYDTAESTVLFIPTIISMNIRDFDKGSCHNKTKFE